MTEKKVFELYRDHYAIWSFNHQGDCKAPHAEWTGGLCADGYINSRLVLCYPGNVELLAAALIEKMGKATEIATEWVIGSANAAITISYEVARRVRAHHGVVKKSFIWDELEIPKYTYVVQCEELIATSGTVIKARNAIEQGNRYPVQFHPEILTVIYYPEIARLPLDLRVLSLVALKVNTWKKNDCPLCAAGSPRLRPAQNWEMFMPKK